MDDTGYVTLTDTTRDELRVRIGRARERFDRLIRTADPDARVPGLNWTVHQVVAHVLSVAHRYQAVIEGRDFRRAERPRDLDLINDAELEAVMAPILQLADQLEALAPIMDAFFDDTTNDQRVYKFHCGEMFSGVTAQTNWLGELQLHGRDIARAVKAPWKIDDRDMLLVLRGGMEVGPGYLRADISSDLDLSVAMKLRDARPFVIHIHDGIAEFRGRRPADRPDAVVWAPALTLTELLYQRIGPLTAARRGMLIVGGRRPWRALQLQSFFEPV
jgi:hypothetical protein